MLRSSAPPRASSRSTTRRSDPFHYRATDEELADLKRRIKATKWPDRETVNDTSQGVQLATMQKLADYWANHHDWRRAEAQIFSYPNFVTNIDGLDIHFIHVKSKHPNALPVIVTHGWPGSIIEQLKIIGPLTDPTAHGGTAADAFDVVIPSLPGYGFSGKPTAPGWDRAAHRRAWATLMNRLGYTRYVAQGGDWGNAISEVMALQQPPGLLAIHTNMSATLPEAIRKALPAGPPPPGLSPDEQHAWDQLTDFYVHGLGYAIEMNQRPQSLYALADSPIGLAAWMLDHDIQSYELIARVFDGAQRRPDPRRHPRQCHALLADQHRGFVGAAVLGDAQQQGRLLRSARRAAADRRQRVPLRNLPGAGELGADGLSAPRFLPGARQRHALRGVGAAAACWPRTCARPSGQCAEGVITAAASEQRRPRNIGRCPCLSSLP